MIWKFELNVDDANAAKTFKNEILNIDPNIVVHVTKNNGQYLIKSSVERVGGGLGNKVNVTRALKKLYDKYEDKISYYNETVTKKSRLRTLIEEVIKEVRGDYPHRKQKLTETEQDIPSAIDAYVDKLNKFSEALSKREKSEIPPDIYQKYEGKTWTKILQITHGGKGQKSVFAFIDKQGNIYKPASWNTPAKGSRGSVLDQNPPLTGRDLYK